jgi:opacity protein-like surface antigen
VIGYNFSRVFSAYYKLGVAGGRFHVLRVLTSDIPMYDANGSRNEGKDVDGFRMGLGVSVALSKNLNLRNEFVLTRFNHVNLRRQFQFGNPTPPEPAEGILSDGNFSVLSEQYNMGLEYQLPF